MPNKGLILASALVTALFSLQPAFAGGDHKMDTGHSKMDMKMDHGKMKMDSHMSSDASLHAIGVKVGEAFTFQPFDPPQANHLWMKTDPGKMNFFHFAKPTAEKDNKVLFIGDGIKGRFCAEDQPDGGKTGFVHFHVSKIAMGHDKAHGGEKGQEGYWLRHIALDTFSMKNKNFTPGIAHNFFATPPPSCGM